MGIIMQFFGDEPSEIIGQIIGVIAVFMTLLSYQMKTNKQLLIVQTIATALFSVHYYLIGAFSGLALNILAIARNLVFYYRDSVKLLSGKAVPWIFAALMAVFGIFPWRGWHTVLITAGIAINTIFLSLPDAQKIRKSILLTSPMVLIYDVFEGSVGGIVNESVAILSSIVGIIRYRKARSAEATENEGEQKQ